MPKKAILPCEWSFERSLIDILSDLFGLCRFNRRERGLFIQIVVIICMMPQIFCPIRRLYVSDLPEERVRQNLISFMINKLGFPKSYIAVERELKTLPHLMHSNLKIPDRRADIICFSKHIHPKHCLFPLILIECKAVPLTQKVIQQATGYNHCVQALYVCIANETQIKTGWYSLSKKAYEFVDYLPFYKDLHIKK